MQQQRIVYDFSKLRQCWASSIVSRDQIERFTGGVINRRTLANLDSKGEGPARRFMVGRKVVYPVESVCDWLADRATMPCKKF